MHCDNILDSMIRDFTTKWAIWTRSGVLLLGTQEVRSGPHPESETKRLLEDTRKTKRKLMICRLETVLKAVYILFWKKIIDMFKNYFLKQLYF